MLYFAYGSNMSTPRLRRRVSRAVPVATARLPGCRLAFHKLGADGSGKCDACPAGRAEEVVWGVVFELDERDRAHLDRAEGAGVGYEPVRVQVWSERGERITALSYRAVMIRPGLKPFDWYLEHVLRGACEHGLPADYVAAIRGIGAMPDPNRGRYRQELSIYRERP